MPSARSSSGRRVAQPFGGEADARPLRLGLPSAVAGEQQRHVMRLAAGPMYRRDLVPGQPDQEVAMAQRVIDEGELVVAGEGGEPE